jgi:hypothetical protein
VITFVLINKNFKYSMELQEIITNKKRGDLSLAAEILGLKQSNTAKALHNSKHPRHAQVVDTISIIIKARTFVKNAF